MSNRIIIIIISVFTHLHLQGQQFVSSNLPVIVINTHGQAIVDEPKITATMQVYDRSDGDRNNINSNSPIFEGPVGIELRGQSSQSIFPKKGYGIETRHNDGSDLDTSILNMPKESDWVIHSPYSDKSLIRNTLAYILAGEIMPYAPRVKLAELVLNGDYQGAVVWTEKIKRGKNRVDISKLDITENSGDDLTGGYIIKFDKGQDNEIGWVSPYNPIPGSNKETRFLYHYPKPEDITISQKSYIRSFVDDFEDVLMSDNFADPMSGYAKYIDVSSFVSTVIINELTRNVDGYRLSTYMYKDKDSKGGKLAMGPTWDHNLSWGNANYCNGSSVSGWAYDFNSVCPDDYWVNHFWWKRLMGEPQFRQLVKDKWLSLRRTTFSTESIISKIDSLVNLEREAAQRNFIRWPILGQHVWPNQFVGQTYQSEIDYLKNWIIQRTEWLDFNFEKLTTAVTNVNDIEHIQVYPNPTSGVIYIDGLNDIVKIEVYTMNGQLIHSEKTNRQFSTTLEIREIQELGIVWYRLIKYDGNMITGKISLYK